MVKLVQPISVGDSFGPLKRQSEKTCRRRQHAKSEPGRMENLLAGPQVPGPQFLSNLMAGTHSAGGWTWQDRARKTEAPEQVIMHYMRDRRTG
jgi:hypothetical protein